ncbi:hypothetical protein CO038_04320 [Candidatus Pacearchaeota archaeon CG_4_9_14_0_2_um_filter_39_13]|nr:hypothetical protein [Candidatus Pacearchaeota archaeon]OIO42739.1 MAG: hypothetical protein AUJ64_03630 [Candidatus Pacearchaeota archaeon CG1_02_39_14]PJC44294.1 MAG: hypothetical protein CO038_04320 [Candidatus Pacearchaeota archaeon CG_4_9_14_0_2_um_filter_39_13]
MSDDGSGCLTFILGVVFGAACITPKACHYSPARVFTADLNGDQIRDIILENNYGEREIFMGTEDGNYIPLDTYCDGKYDSMHSMDRIESRAREFVP